MTASGQTPEFSATAAGKIDRPDTDAGAATLVDGPQPAPTVGTRDRQVLEGNPVVMVVDDDTMVCYVIARSLRAIGCTVVEARGPDDALALLLEMPRLDLVVTDVMMPKMNGWQLTQRLRQHVPELPVIFMSGFLPDSVFADGVVPAGAPLLAKPFSREELFASVRSQLPDPARRQA
jgi:CheY-like chemotaxis protein